LAIRRYLERTPSVYAIPSRLTDGLERHRLFLAITLGLAVGVVNLLLKYAGLPNDLAIPHCGAQRLIAGLNPYSCPTAGTPSDPLTTILALIPLAWLPAEVASGVIMGLSTGLLTYALNRKGESWRLIALLSVPFIYAVQVSQWAPLFLADVYLEWLYPIVLVKPHFGLSIAVMKATPLRLGLLAAVSLGSLLIYPGWLGQWLQQARSYDGFLPLLTLPGPLLLLALLRWRGEPAKWLLLMSVTPQRAWYHQLMLWVIPASPRQAIALTVCSWIMWLPHIVWGAQALGNFTYPWLIVSLYGPALVLVLRSSPQKAAVREPQSPLVTNA
jgi:hypothetical protein